MSVAVQEKPVAVEVDSLVSKVIEVAQENKGVAIISDYLTQDELKQTLIDQDVKVYDVTIVKLDSLEPDYIRAFEAHMPKYYKKIILDQRNFTNFDVRLLNACKKLQHVIETIKVTGKK